MHDLQAVSLHYRHPHPCNPTNPTLSTLRVPPSGYCILQSHQLSGTSQRPEELILDLSPTCSAAAFRQHIITRPSSQCPNSHSSSHVIITMATSTILPSAIHFDRRYSPTKIRLRRAIASESQARCQTCARRRGSCTCIAHIDAITSLHETAASIYAQGATTSHSPSHGSLPKLAQGIDTIPMSMASVTGKRVLDFYSTRTSGFLACFLSTTETANPWYTEVMPLAIQSPMVRDSMLALGGSHLAHMQQDSAVQRTAMYHYAKAVSEVTPSIRAWLRGDFAKTASASSLQPRC